MTMREFSRAELARFNGDCGSDVYIAYKGKVYDVSESWHWKGGSHQVMHTAGQDLSPALDKAPHAEDLLDRVPVIGSLVEQEDRNPYAGENLKQITET